MIRNEELIGTCEKNCNEGNVCPEGFIYKNSHREGVCLDVDYLEGQTCSCRCVGDSEILPTRKLTWPRENRVDMCHIVSTNPTTFRDIQVPVSKVVACPL